VGREAAEERLGHSGGRTQGSPALTGSPARSPFSVLAVASASQDLPKTTGCVNANATVNVAGDAPPWEGNRPQAEPRAAQLSR
jgi:hypothetical protein